MQAIPKEPKQPAQHVIMVEYVPTCRISGTVQAVSPVTTTLTVPGQNSMSC